MQRSCLSLVAISEDRGYGKEVVHACLSRSNDISILENSRDGVRLNGSRMDITAEFDVVHHDWVQPGLSELLGLAMQRKAIRGYSHH